MKQEKPEHDAAAHASILMTLARSLQKKSNDDTSDNGESTGAEAAGRANGGVGRDGGGNTRSVSGRRGRLDDGGRRLGRGDEGAARVHSLAGAGGPDGSRGGGDGSRSGGDRDLGGGGGRAGGEGNGLDAGLGGHDNTLALAAVLTLTLLLDDFERVGVLEDAGVALKLDDEAVEGISAERGIDSPGVLVVSVGNTACYMLD